MTMSEITLILVAGAGGLVAFTGVMYVLFIRWSKKDAEVAEKTREQFKDSG